MATYSNENYNYAGYASGRPSYNPDFPKFIIEYHKRIPSNQTDTVVDVATGTGISARYLSGYFKRVIGTDISPKMLEVASQSNTSDSNVEYMVCPGEDMSEIPDHSVDVVASATGAHWFDSEKFANEARRILKPNGTLAIYGYSGFGSFIDYPECDVLMREYGIDVLGPYWDTGRQVLERLYSHYNVLLREMDFKDVFMGVYPKDVIPYIGTNYTLMEKPHVINFKITWRALHKYLDSWSSLSNYHVKHPNKRRLSDVYVEKMMAVANETDFEKEINFEWGQSVVLARV
ncbi:hypothetical protein BB558_002218 [Smittium angustum]|uniref:Methyltransferase type 11 domain-containing protein n=1 Tax=Smittium angustum TaxID=133377 RepID=A0A2U1J999_SMIAN|nr:hypothetical protein BB558_002218 [Smittium angustum]